MRRSRNNTPISYLLARYKGAVYERCIAPLLENDFKTYATTFELLTQTLTERVPTSDNLTPLRSGLAPADADWYRKQIGAYDQSIASLEQLIGGVNTHCEDMNLPFAPKVDTCYQRLLRRYESQLEQAYSMRRLLFERLGDR